MTTRNAMSTVIIVGEPPLIMIGTDSTDSIVTKARTSATVMTPAICGSRISTRMRRLPAPRLRAASMLARSSAAIAPETSSEVASAGTNTSPFASRRVDHHTLVAIAYTAGYSTTPPEVAQACIELVALRYRERTRIGEVSRSLGGAETVAYAQKDVSDAIKTLLQRYRLVSPITAVQPIPTMSAQ
jgi:hypothetical protein